MEAETNSPEDASAMVCLSTKVFNDWIHADFACYYMYLAEVNTLISYLCPKSYVCFCLMLLVYLVML